MKKFVIFFSLIISLCSVSIAQRPAMPGKVTEILDGRTFVFDTGKTKFNIRLQFIDPPESTQPLHDVVKNHLSAMIKDKTVHVELSGLSGGLSVAKVYLDGVDVSMQILRDGAAWYSVPETNSQAEQDRTEYLQAESLARSEKRGVWSLPESTVPAWQLRVDREKAFKVQLEEEQRQLALRIARSGLPTRPTMGMTYTELMFLCGSHGRDYLSVTETGKGREIFTILYATSPERIQKMCFGSFSFNESGKLNYIKRDTN